MNQNLQHILELIKHPSALSDEQRLDLEKRLKAVDKELEIALFKLDRTEKVKRTTAILLEETIEELELKRKVIEESNRALQQSLADLEAAQAQLIQSEKMASLGELTAGIAHEIQNPLNFVNNFSEVSNEMVVEIEEERAKNAAFKDEALIDELLLDIKLNLDKINHHGKRADAIVKGMLQHSRSSSGQKEPTDLNALADEYLRLAYHGLRAKDNSFNIELATSFDGSLPMANVIPQDIGRVLLNLLTNAFYATQQRKGLDESFKPVVEILTSVNGNSIEIAIKDTGNGIAPSIVKKIFQPFFTTKPTGEGTGLGLSLAYDIVKAHGGDLRVETEVDLGSTFTVCLPIK